MDTFNEDGLETSGSPSDTGSDAGASPASNDSMSDSSSEQEERTSSLDAISNALNSASESSDDSGAGEQDKSKEKGENEELPGADDKSKEEGETLSEEDELLKPLPEGTPEKTAQRFEKLTEGFKSLREENKTILAEKEALQNYRNDFDSLIQHSGATADEFNDLIEYSHLVKSGNLQGALDMLDAQRSNIAAAMGITLPGIDLFKDYPDLQEAIDNHEINEERAAEVVKARKLEAQSKLKSQTQSQQQQEAKLKEQNENKFNQQIQTASKSIAAMVAEWEKNDINFPAKQAALIKKTEEIAQKYQPDQWAEILQLQYDAIKVEAKSSTTAGAGQQHRPLRPGNGGGGKKEPTSSLDAITQALTNAQ